MLYKLVGTFDIPMTGFLKIVVTVPMDTRRVNGWWSMVQGMILPMVVMLIFVYLSI